MKEAKFPVDWRSGGGHLACSCSKLEVLMCPVHLQVGSSTPVGDLSGLEREREALENWNSADVLSF